jgi:hypothetical protein
MPQAQNFFRKHISKPLRAHYDETVREPLPQRWVDLINYLNEREQMLRKSSTEKGSVRRTPSSAKLRRRHWHH